MSTVAPLYFAQKAFISHNNCVLAIKRADSDPQYAGQWEFPGGHLEVGETLDESLVREVREETGLSVTAGEVFSMVTLPPSPAAIPPHDIIVAGRLATCSDVSALTDIYQLEEDHIQTMAWVPYEDMAQLNWIVNLQPMVAAFLSRIGYKPTLAVRAAE